MEASTHMLWVNMAKTNSTSNVTSFTRGSIDCKKPLRFAISSWKRVLCSQEPIPSIFLSRKLLFPGNNPPDAKSECSDDNNANYG